MADEISKRNISIRDFAKMVGVSHPTISAILNGETPSYEVCLKLAPVLRQSIEMTLRAAGLLPADRDANPAEQELIHLYRLLPESEQKRALEYTRFLLSQSEAEEKPKKR